MIQARIHQGKVQLQDPIPTEWEGQVIQLVPLTPNDPMADLEERLAALHAMGPMEFESGEVEGIAAEREEMDQLSKAAMGNLASRFQ